MIGLIGKKVGMTQLFSEQGEAVPVTVIEAGPCTVCEVRTAERDGYNAVQLGFGARKEKSLTRPAIGQFKKRNLPPSGTLREFRVDTLEGFAIGQTLTVSLFEKGQHVDVQGVTKGRGFQGVIKRYGFRGGHATHGPTMGREPGSVGASAYPSRVIKGKRLPGHMGAENLTIKNLEVVAIDPEQNTLMVRGAVPGPANGIVFIKKRNG